MFDRWLLGSVGVLVAAGLFMVGSASQYEAMRTGQDGSYFMIRHLLFAIAGLLLLLGAMKVSYTRLDDRRLVIGATALTFVALVAVLAMTPSGGARRWFRFGPLSLQPAEFAKLVVVVGMAWLLSRYESSVNDARRFLLPVGGGLLVMLFLINLQPDLGSGVMIAIVAAALVFLAGLRWSYIGGAATVGVGALVVAILLQPYRIKRITAFMNPDADVLGSAFQLNQSLLALGAGGIGGVGFGQGQQKAGYLPAAHTDFIYSVIGEEFGLVGTLFLLAVVGVLFWRGLRAAQRAPDRFGFYLAMGCTVLLVAQSLIHMGVCAGVLPTKGLPLPFVSYGGSSLWTSFIAAGLLLNVSQNSR
jgi:cell division protein FtsW